MTLSLMATQVIFKEVWTNHTRIFNVNPYWTVTQFLDSMRPLIKNEFNINNFEIVEAGQYIPGIPSEEAPSLIASDIIIRNKWGPKLSVSFYIRRKNYNYLQLRELSIRQNIIGYGETNISTNPILMNLETIEECPICLENIQFINNRNNFGCSHNICNECYINCQVRNYTSCPICRNEMQ